MQRRHFDRYILRSDKRDFWTDGYDLCRHAKAFAEVNLKAAAEAAARSHSALA